VLDIRLKYYTALIPYVTVFFGLHIFKSAWAAILLYHAAIFIVILATDRFMLFKRLYQGWNWKIGLPLTVLSALSGLALYYLWPVSRIQGQDLAAILGEYGLSGYSWQIFMVYYCVETPIIEEVFWRGYLLAPGRYPSAPDFLFAGYHVTVLILFLKPLPVAAVFIALVITAWIWRILALKFEGLAIPFTSHLVAGVSLMWFVNLLLKG
jgi:membrane protease YdiL (CAAX protease family)